MEIIQCRICYNIHRITIMNWVNFNTTHTHSIAIYSVNKTIYINIYIYIYVTIDWINYHQCFKRQLKTPTCFGSFVIHPQGVLNVLD